MITLIFILLAMLVGAVYYTWIFSYSCNDISCFQSYQEKCRRATFTRDAEETTWKYSILGKGNDACEIQATAIRIKSGKIDRQKLQGLSMNCFVSLGSKIFPEAKILECHGLLKEEIQQLMIKNAHAQILANIDKVSSEIAKEELEKVI